MSASIHEQMASDYLPEFEPAPAFLHLGARDYMAFGVYLPLGRYRLEKWRGFQIEGRAAYVAAALLVATPVILGFYIGSLLG